MTTDSSINTDYDFEASSTVFEALMRLVDASEYPTLALSEVEDVSPDRARNISYAIATLMRIEDDLRCDDKRSTSDCISHYTQQFDPEYNYFFTRDMLTKRPHWFSDNELLNLVPFFDKQAAVECYRDYITRRNSGRQAFGDGRRPCRTDPFNATN